MTDDVSASPGPERYWLQAASLCMRPLCHTHGCARSLCVLRLTAFFSEELMVARQWSSTLGAAVLNHPKHHEPSGHTLAEESNPLPLDSPKHGQQGRLATCYGSQPGKPGIRLPAVRVSFFGDFANFWLQNEHWAACLATARKPSPENWRNFIAAPKAWSQTVAKNQPPYRQVCVPARQPVHCELL